MTQDWDAKARKTGERARDDRGASWRDDLIAQVARALAAAYHHSEPRVSVDGLELRAPLEPAIHEKFIAAARYTMPPRANQ